MPLRPSRRCRCALLPAANHRCSCRGPLTPILGTAALYSMPSAKCRSAHCGGVAAPPLGTVPPTVAALTPRSWRLSSAPTTGAAMRSRPRRYALPLTAAPLIAVARTADRRALTQYRRARCRSVHPHDAAVSSVNYPPAHAIALAAGTAASFVDTPSDRYRRAVTAATLSLSLLTAAPPITVLLVARPLHYSSAPSTRCRKAGHGGDAAPPPHCSSARSFHSPRDRCA